MNALRFTRLAAALVVALSVTAAHAVTIDWVTVGDPGNANDTTGYGAVADSFRIMKHEWTNAQYVAFLNAVDPDGTNPDSIYSGAMGVDARGGISFTAGNTVGMKYAARTNMADKPVNYVSWLDAARVANWLEAGGIAYGSSTSGSAAINNGAYTLNGVTSGTAPAKNAGAHYWVPMESEWYKAAYYKGSGTNAGYYAYSTQSDSAPLAVGATVVGTGTSGGVSPVTSGNFANFDSAAIWNGQTGNVTTVGSNGGPSAYGTFDQSGNVDEWMGLDNAASPYGGLRGGRWFDSASNLSSSYRTASSPANEFPYIGFRLASTVGGPAGVPEIDPAGMGSVLALVAGTLAWLERRRFAA
jgi:formylglycine-generating enzyme required for sulfatase activity